LGVSGGGFSVDVEDAELDSPSGPASDSDRWRSLSGNIGLRHCPLSRILEGVNPLSLKNGHFMQSRMALEKMVNKYYK
jgi:hypothetical protein